MLLHLFRSQIFHPTICTILPAFGMCKHIYFFIEEFLNVWNPEGVTPLHPMLNKVDQNIFDLNMLDHMNLVPMERIVQARICTKCGYKGNKCLYPVSVTAIIVLHRRLQNIRQPLGQPRRNHLVIEEGQNEGTKHSITLIFRTYRCDILTEHLLKYLRLNELQTHANQYIENAVCVGFFGQHIQ